MNILTYAGLFILLGLTVFQILLVMGRPYGEFAWGGQHKVLPVKLRLGSVLAIALYGVFASFLVSKADLVNVVTNQSVLNNGMWAFTGYFMLGVAMNLISRSKKERAVMVPISLVLAIVFLVVALN